MSCCLLRSISRAVRLTPLLRRAAIKAADGLGPITTEELQDEKCNALSAEKGAAFMAREPSAAPVLEADTDTEGADDEDADMDC